MKKMQSQMFFCLFLTLFSVNLQAEDSNNHQPGAEVIDLIFLRPAGLVSLIGGSALYLGLSPLTALATISPPHDAFERLANHLLLKPFAFTFDRPLGEMKSNDRH